MGFETRYVGFRPGELAAAEMFNHLPLFEKFVSGIRHRHVLGGSIVDYKFHFMARPRYLRWLLEPLMLRYLQHETRCRLLARTEFLE